MVGSRRMYRNPRDRPLCQPPQADSKIIGVDEEINSLEIKGSRFFARRNAGKLASTSVRELLCVGNRPKAVRNPDCVKILVFENTAGDCLGSRARDMRYGRTWTFVLDKAPLMCQFIVR
jgi:hypothetical protein